MIGGVIDKALVEALDSRDTSGRMLIIQIGPIVITWYIGWGKGK